MINYNNTQSTDSEELPRNHIHTQENTLTRLSYELLTSEIDANTLNEHTTMSKYYNHYMWLKYSKQGHMTSSANGWELQLLC